MLAFWIFLLAQIVCASSKGIDSDLLQALINSVEHTEQHLIPLINELKIGNTRSDLEEKAEALLISSRSSQTKALTSLLLDYFDAGTVNLGYACLTSFGYGDKYRTLLRFLLHLRKCEKVSPLLNIGEEAAKEQLFAVLERHFELGVKVFSLMSLKSTPLDILESEVANRYLAYEKFTISRLSELQALLNNS